MAFPIIPKKRSGSAGNPGSLTLGELAVNCFTGELFLGADEGVTLLNGPVAAGTTTTEATGDGTTTAFTFTGYNGTADGGYLVSVGGIDQPPSKYSVTDTAGGTLTFVEAPTTGELISIRAIVAGGGGGDGNATQIQGRDVANTAPDSGQVLAWSAANSRWQPTSLNATVDFNTPGTHTWAVPAWVRWVYVSAAASNGSDGTATSGADGQVGASASEGIPPSTGSNGTNGTATPGVAGQSITIAAVDFSLLAGTAGLEGLFGYGGGGSGGGSSGEFGYSGSAGASGQGAEGGGGGGAGLSDGVTNGIGGTAGGGSAGAGAAGNTGGSGGAGAIGGGDGGGGGSTGLGGGNGGGGGGGNNRSGGGGGGGGCFYGGQTPATAGAPGKGGTADISMCAGGAGETFDDSLDLSSVAGTNIFIVISEGAGNASITITY